MTFDVRVLLADESPDAGIVTTADGIVAHWNKGAQAVYGYVPESAHGRPLAELVVPPDGGGEHAQRMADTLRNGSAVFESLRRRQDGSLLYMDVSSRCVADPSSEGQRFVLLVERNVTHAKVQRDARLMEARFRDLLESTPDGIVMANPTGHIVIANSQAEKLFGYATGELRGQSVDQLLPERYRKAHVGHRFNYFLQPRQRAMGSGLDLAGLRKDGTEFPIEISLSPLRTEESAFVMSAIRDISERKSFQKALQDKNIELANANQAKDRFLASMSHELRTPLNAIIGFTGTLLMRLPGPLTSEQEKQLRTVQTSGRHLLALINDLLDVAKIEAGKVDLLPELLDCREVAEEVAAALRPQAAAKGLQFAVDAMPADVMLETDRRALSQILLNLAGNAVKFTDRGSVLITFEQRSAGTDEPGDIAICVVDSGGGMTVEQQSRLFGAFSRVHVPDATQPEGTGLGLHLSQKLAFLLGGRIDVQSAPNLGSRFTLTLPSKAGSA